MAYIEVLAALADPTRRLVFERLRAGESPVGAIAQGLPVSRPAVSQHLRALHRAGLVTERRQGASRFYRVRQEGLEGLLAWIESFREADGGGEPPAPAQ